MRQKDFLSKNYMDDNDRFSDLFNYYLYHGTKNILADDLISQDSAEITSQNAAHPITQTQKWRDLLKRATIKTNGKCSYVLLGIENQSNIQYTMPIKNLLYDVINYDKQVGNIAKHHRKNMDLSKEEYLSGFAKKDKLTPVITIALYLGTKKWDAPRSLHDMMLIPDNLEQFVADYHLNLIIPGEMNDADFNSFTTDLRELFLFLKYADNPEKLSEIIQQDVNFHSMNKDTVSMLNTYASAGITYHEEQETVNMCYAIEELKRRAAESAANEAREAAREEAAVQIKEIQKETATQMKEIRKKAEKKTKKAMVKVVDNIIKKMMTPLEDACDIVGITPEQYYKYKKFI